jgi:hypothetical protein
VIVTGREFEVEQDSVCPFSYRLLNSFKNIIETDQIPQELKRSVVSQYLKK